ncbi:MAG: RNA polymerase sigma factor [Chloroflexota bacterium]
MLNLTDLIRRCQQGDLHAFATLYDEFQDEMFDLAWTILGEREAAKDAVQETFLIVFQKIDGYRGDAAFTTWLTAILVNTCRQKLRRRQLRQLVPWHKLSPRWLSKVAESPSNPAHVVARRLETQLLWQMVDTLDDRLRLPILLRYRHGLGCDEIAVALGLSINTIYEQLSQGRKELRRLRREREAGRWPLTDS